MLRIYYDHELQQNQIIPLIDDFHYIVHVHRLKTEDEMICFNHQYEFLCKIEQIKKNTVFVKTIQLLRAQSENHTIRLIIGMIKSKRLKWVVEKAVEIGVKEILIANTHRAQSYEYALDKLYSVAKQALQQSKNMIMPKIEYIEMKSVLHANYRMCILDMHGKHVSEIPTCDTILIGPEGGLTADELSQLSSKYPQLSLSNSTLRSETAAILAIHTLQYWNTSRNNE